jgi:hypothetical protein
VALSRYQASSSESRQVERHHLPVQEIKDGENPEGDLTPELMF